MVKLGFNRRSLAVACTTIVIAAMGLIVTTTIVSRPQWTASGAEVGTEKPASAESTPQEHRSPEPASSRGDRATESSAQQSAPQTSASPGDTRGPGLASPIPSQLDTAAAAIRARVAAGQTIRVGVQAGHWKNSELPDELAILRGSTGAMGVGWREVDVNLDVARKVASQLSSYGIQADLLPATVPVGYRADAFVAIHADANGNKSLTGFKIARATWSTIPKTDDSLIDSLTNAYQQSTGLAWHAKTITDNMTEYYAFNHKLQHSVSSSTPAVILEMGFLTNQADQSLMLTQSERVAQAVTLGILNFLAE